MHGYIREVVNQAADVDVGCNLEVKLCIFIFSKNTWFQIEMSLTISTWVFVILEDLKKFDI